MAHHHGVRLACLLALVSLSSGCAYEAGTFRSRAVAFDGQPVTLGCLDVAVGRARDSFAQGALVSFAFGNRCEQRVTVDLVTVRAVAHGANLVPWDPRGELAIATLPARSVGQEVFEYRGARADEPICVDIGGIDRDIARVEKWVCL